jgi:DNA-binding response OmpR family regulator
VRLLVVEDDNDLINTLARGLRRAGFAVDLAVDGAEALDRARVNRYDVVVLDRELPVIHGDDVCRELHERAVPVVMLTASSGIADCVTGLNLGADDYVGKPFHFNELIARVRAVARRGELTRHAVLSRSGVRLDPNTGDVWRDSSPIALTNKERSVLEVLLAADGAIVSAEDLLERVWDEQIDPFTNVVRMTVTKLRRKLGEPTPVVTVVGRGYRIP